MSRRKHRHLIAAGVVIAIVAAIAGVAVVVTAELKLTRLVPGGLGESFSTRIYSAPFAVGPNQPVSSVELLTRLDRLSYHPVDGEPKEGEYHWKEPYLMINLRGFQTPVARQDAGMFELERQRGDRWSVSTVDRRSVDSILLEPELAAELSGPNKVRRDPGAWSEYPDYLPKAVVAIEDRRFYSHHGIDFRAIARAAWYNLQRGTRGLQGGSTITQQLAKNLFLTHKRTLRRKMVEAFLAIYLDIRYPKEKILTLYLNQIYMGQDGFVSVAGMKAAARFYFGKPLETLTLSEAATLAGVIRSPYRYNPIQNPEEAKSRRDLVLSVMKELEFITPEQTAAAQAEPIKTAPRVAGPGTSNDNDYFVAEVVRRILPRYNEDMLYRYGLRIYTTLDPYYQRIAQTVLRTTKNQAALVAVNPESGAVLALAGGRNYRESQFNRATQALRQPGSAFKPFVYGAALESGLTPATILSDEPRAYTDGTKVWAPQNFDRVYRGTVTLRQALSASLNAATLDLAERIGTGSIIRFARKLGIKSPLERSLAVALGACEVTPLELTAAYAPFANGGFLVDPYLVTAVMDAENNLLEVATPERQSVLDPALAYLITSLLESTVTGGTAQSLKSLGFAYPAAGKTGTTNEGRDAWFIGFTPELLTGVWVGNDDGKSANLTGARHALPIWAAFMKAVFGSRGSGEFERPQGVVSVKIDPGTGLLARSGCPVKSEELFVSGTQPTKYCTLHAGGLKGFLQNIFRRNQPAAPAQQGRD